MASQETIELAHLNTYFLFPFSIDKVTVVENHPALWAKYTHWIDGIDEWIAEHRTEKTPVLPSIWGDGAATRMCGSTWSRPRTRT